MNRVVVLAFIVAASRAIAQAPAAEATPQPGRELLERVAHAYNAMNAYRDVFVMREIYEPGDDPKSARVLNEIRAEVALQRPAQVKLLPAGSGANVRIQADGKNLTLADESAGLVTTMAQEGSIFRQLAGIESASLFALSLPALFFFEPDALGQVSETYGEASRRKSKEDEASEAGAGFDVVEFALGGGASVRLYVDPISALLVGARLIEPIVVEDGVGGRRVVELLYLTPRADPQLGAQVFKYEPSATSRRLTLEEFEAARLEERSLVGRAMPDFTVPAAADGEEPFSPEDVAGRPVMLAFVQTWSSEGAEIVTALEAVASAGAQVVLVAMDEQSDKARRGVGLANYLDPGGAVAASLGIEGAAMIFVLGRDSLVRAEVTGARTVAELTEIWQRASKE